MSAHCQDNGADRALGEKWERAFASLVAEYRGGLISAHQIRCTRSAVAVERECGGWRTYLLPDVTLWSFPGEHHEIKHKEKTRFGAYGLEKYRFDALCHFSDETRQAVCYTIHDWRAAGASSSRDEMPNRIDDWLTAEVVTLKEHLPEEREMRTYLNGGKTMRPGYYWDAELWMPLSEWFETRAVDQDVRAIAVETSR